MARSNRAQKEVMGNTGLEATTVGKINKDVSEVSMGVIIAFAALIGVWGVACIVGGIVNSGGLTELMSGYITAVSGG